MDGWKCFDIKVHNQIDSNRSFKTIESLKTVVGPVAIEYKEIQKEISTYEEDHFKQVSLSDDKIVLSKYTKDDEGYYHDQNKKIKI